MNQIYEDLCSFNIIKEKLITKEFILRKLDLKNFYLYYPFSIESSINKEELINFMIDNFQECKMFIFPRKDHYYIIYDDYKFFFDYSDNLIIVCGLYDNVSISSFGNNHINLYDLYNIFYNSDLPKLPMEIWNIILKEIKYFIIFDYKNIYVSENQDFLENRECFRYDIFQKEFIKIIDFDGYIINNNKLIILYENIIYTFDENFDLLYTEVNIYYKEGDKIFQIICNDDNILIDYSINYNRYYSIKYNCETNIISRIPYNLYEKVISVDNELIGSISFNTIDEYFPYDIIKYKENILIYYTTYEKRSAGDGDCYILSYNNKTKERKIIFYNKRCLQPLNERGGIIKYKNNEFIRIIERGLYIHTIKEQILLKI